MAFASPTMTSWAGGRNCLAREGGNVKMMEEGGEI
jgi:hypothetical protein